MVDISLNDITIEKKNQPFLKRFGEKGTRWAAWVSLALRDNVSGQPMAEWFYLIVCSPECKRSPFKDLPEYDERYFILQEQFDLEVVRNIAKQRLAMIQAKTWDEFYDKIETSFLCEEPY